MICLFCAAKFAIKDRRVRVSFLSFLLRTCSMQHVLGAWFGAQFEPDLACSLSLIWRAV